MREPRRAHWFACQKCGSFQATRNLDFFGEATPPRKPCKVCRDPAIDFHYVGFVANPYKPIMGAREQDREEDLSIANGFRGTCKVCGKVLKVRVPRAKFFPGDGTVRMMFKHKNHAGQPCEGSGRPAVEWDF